MLTSYIVKRLLVTPLYMVAAASVIFLVLRVLPGDPAVAMLGDDVSPEALARFREQSGMNQPLSMQYLSLLRRLLSFDLGSSLINQDPVFLRVAFALPYTLQVLLVSSVIGIVLGTSLGFAAALFPGSRLDTAVGAYVGAIGGMPNYVMGIMLLLLFAVTLKMFPVSSSTVNDPWSAAGLRALVLPGFALGLAESASIARIARAAAVQLLGHALFIQALRARGVSERRIKYIHVLRNCMVPILAVATTQVASQLSGTILLENIFNRPGVGTVLVLAVRSRDFPVVEGTLLMLTGMVVLLGLFTDLVNAFVDPRISYK